MALETVTLDHVPGSYSIHYALFRNVKNASFLHQQLIARNAAFEYGFIDASVVFSRLQLLSAVYKAVTLAENKALKTPNVHSEIVAALSASNNIADAYRRLGVSPSTKDLVVVKVTFPTEAEPQPPSNAEIWEHLNSNIEGDAVPMTDENLADMTDLSKVRKYYKLNALRWLDDIRDTAVQRKEIEALILGGMALRGV